MDQAHEWRFDGWTLLRASGELVGHGTRIHLPPQPQQVLEALLERPGEMVTREHLKERLWPRGVVEFDTALNSAVRRLRTALGDQADTPRYIETIPRRGYRFIGALESPAFAEAKVAAVAPTAAAHPPAPCVVESAGRPAVPPVPSSAPAAWWRRPGPGRRVPAGWLVVAGVGVLLWALWGAASFESLREPHPRSGSSAEAASEPPGPAGAAHPAAAQAGEVLARAQFFFQRRGPGDVERAKQLFAQALAVDPGLARAWVGLAGVHWIEAVEGRAPRDAALAALRDAANRALALDPGLAEAHLRLGHYYLAKGDRPAQLAQVSRALELEPGNPMSLSAASGLALSAGRLDEAVALQRRAVEADPLTVAQRYNLAWLLYLAGRWAEADEELVAVRDLTRDPQRVASLRCLVAVADGRFLDARELAGAIPRDVERQQCLALAHHGLGRAADADAALRSLVQSAGDRHLVEIAEVYAFRGDTDRAFEWLETAIARSRSKDVFPPERRQSWSATYSPLMQSLHADPRWPAVLQDLGRSG
jgi:DNA-binding winged helix-turn-helix (wHTH) protein/tetratricopeptide (TPR) repeat protein